MSGTICRLSKPDLRPLSILQPLSLGFRALQGTCANRRPLTVAANYERIKWVELMYHICKGNADPMGRSFFCGVRGFQTHITSIHGTSLHLDEVLEKCQIHEVSAAERNRIVSEYRSTEVSPIPSDARPFPGFPWSVWSRAEDSGAR